MAPPALRIIGRRKSADIKEFREFKEFKEFRKSAINFSPKLLKLSKLSKLSKLLNLPKSQLLIFLFDVLHFSKNIRIFVRLIYFVQRKTKNYTI